tara:strand:+ start:57 stop:242 length:186 start_codon:yes stop_codon:yes gene_type:complete
MKYTLHSVSNKNGELATGFNLESNLLITEKSEEIFQAKLQLQGAEIYASADALQQRFNMRK